MSNWSTLNQFWRHVLDGAAKWVSTRWYAVIVLTLNDLLGQKLLTESEVRQYDVSLSIQQNIFQFNVPIYHTELKRQNSHDETDFFFYIIVIFFFLIRVKVSSTLKQKNTHMYNNIIKNINKTILCALAFFFSFFFCLPCAIALEPISARRCKYALRPPWSARAGTSAWIIRHRSRNLQL